MSVPPTVWTYPEGMKWTLAPSGTVSVFPTGIVSDVTSNAVSVSSAPLVPIVAATSVIGPPELPVHAAGAKWSSVTE